MNELSQAEREANRNRATLHVIARASAACAQRPLTLLSDQEWIFLLERRMKLIHESCQELLGWMTPPNPSIDRHRETAELKAAGLTPDGEVAYPAAPVGGMHKAMQDEQGGIT